MNNEKEMDKEFEEWMLSDEQKAQYAKETTSLEGRSNAFKSAHSLQQEKIDKLEKENKSLRSDLDWSTQINNQTLRFMPSLSSNEQMAQLEAMDKVEEIRARHKLDEVK